MPKEFESGVYTLKTHQMFTVHPVLEKFENVTIDGHKIDLHSSKTSAGKSHTYHDKSIFLFIQFGERL